jgi:phage shock protein PspC (stress-responsive transcriptional regulator)
VAGGLGEYFSVDPVLFRVLFATAAFFGGAGVLGYLLAWAAIPEQGTERAPIDGWIRGLRERRTPFVLMAVVAVVLFWLVAFSWWAPGPSFPLVAVVIVLVLIFGRRGYRHAERDAEPAAPTATSEGDTISLEKAPADGPDSGTTRQAPQWVSDMRQWASESRVASRARRRRAMPLRVAGLGVLAVTLTILGLIDGASGIAIPTYFWFSLAIVGATLLTGLALRRTPWSLTSLLVLSVIGLVGFGGTHASLHDGIGQKEWRPTATTTAAHYRLAFGQGILDLRSLPPVTSPETIDVTIASGQIRVIVPSSMNVSLRAEVHFGNLTVDGTDYDSSDGFRSRGVNLDRTVPALTGATGAPVLVRVHVADGNVSFDHR